MAIQFAPFNNGGFVLHKIDGFPGKRNVSAWFDISGKLIEAEYRDVKMNVRAIRAKDDLNKLRGIGLAYYLTQIPAGQAEWARSAGDAA